MMEDAIAMSWYVQHFASGPSTPRKQALDSSAAREARQRTWDGMGDGRMGEESLARES